ncbi:unnamed protein product [Cochlearia groenlandica]
MFTDLLMHMERNRYHKLEWARLTKRGRFQVVRDKQTGPTKVRRRFYKNGAMSKKKTFKGYTKQYDREDAKESIQSELDKMKKCGIVICIAHAQVCTY